MQARNPLLCSFGNISVSSFLRSPGNAQEEAQSQLILFCATSLTHQNQLVCLSTTLEKTITPQRSLSSDQTRQSHKFSNAECVHFFTKAYSSRESIPDFSGGATAGSHAILQRCRVHPKPDAHLGPVSATGPPWTCNNPRSL